MKALRLSRNNTLFLMIALAALATMALSYFRVLELYELQTYDWRYKIRGSRHFTRQVCLIHIADDTLENYGAWPFNRELHAALIQILKIAGKARAVAFDIVFPEDAGEADLKLGQTAMRAGNVYFAVALSSPELRGGQQVSSQMVAPLVPILAKSAKSVVHVNVVADVDGKRRRVPPIIFYDGKPYVQMAVRLAMDVLGVQEKELRLEPGLLRLGDKVDIPLDDDQCMLISFAGKWVDVFDHYSFAQILSSGKQMADGVRPKMDLQKTFKDRVCIVGYTAAASVDVDATPLERVYPMVGVHANALNSILEKDFIRRLNRLTNALVAVVLGVFVLWISLTKRPLFAFRLTFLTLLFFVTFAIFSFVKWGLWIDLFFPIVSIIGFFSASVVARTIREMRRREVIEKELAIASQIQLSFLPEKLPEDPHLSLDVFMKPAKAVGGDLYGFVALDGGRLGVMLGDVSGKGTPAALFMAKIVSEFKFSSMGENDPSVALTKLNDKVSSERTGGLFVTMTYAIFDPAARRMVFSNGGHLPLVAASADGQTRQITPEGGMPVGVMGGIGFANAEIELHPGDCFAFYSDGVSEARNRKAEEWGVEQLEACLSEFRHRPVDQILKATLDRLSAFMNKADQHDDITLLIVKVGVLS